MNPEAFRILDRKRHGLSLSGEEIRAVVGGTAADSWGDAELAAFLMASAIQGLDAAETRQLTVSMLESGERWELARDFPHLGDKHSTGGVGDKVSLVLGPLLAACDRPLVMLTGRGLGHTGGTADKLEVIPGLDLGLDRERCRRSIEATGLAIGIATGEVAPADRRLYALRDRTATIASLPLITASILSKKLASGAAAIVFDVKTGSGAFLESYEEGRELARLLVETAEALGCRARSLVTDMDQPLGRWAGHSAELREAFDCLEGRGPADLMEVVYALSEELSELTGERLERAALAAAIASGRARERFDRWAAGQGAETGWLAAPSCPLAPETIVLRAPRSGVLATVATRRLGELVAAAGGGRTRPGGTIDHGVALHTSRRIGEPVAQGDELARLHVRRQDSGWAAELAACFTVGDHAAPRPQVLERVLASAPID